MKRLICPVCDLSLGVNCRDGGVVITYDLQDWNARCRQLRCGDPALCKHFRSLMVALLADGVAREPR